MDVLAPIERRPLHNELAERLRHLIVEGDLAPGEKLSERDLCSRFGVSRTPLREALKVLSTEGLVRLIPHRGAAVSKLTISDGGRAQGAEPRALLRAQSADP
jgi:DNA-binding GntR family transcriptional regulator